MNSAAIQIKLSLNLADLGLSPSLSRYQLYVDRLSPSKPQGHMVGITGLGAISPWPRFAGFMKKDLLNQVF